ncbi:IS, phage, Tn Transposon [Candidatus Burkholderia verschuerenii]|uniref:IS, phage, Tn Transposon n=1 Tax=Candidatus Burkholderia verschuerenii TaxID=242163 RepID=A0A0L0MFV1_9BURK|nr:acyltransferase [Candidatus Burkholderia verschuerenii]KND61181.1 IS, phage, Tn Transposon [Candidatus Burkholderia verschuerenii]
MASSPFPLWSACLTTIVCFIVAGALGKRSPMIRDEIDELGHAQRYGYLDGLRGYLAFAVFLTHTASSAIWYRTGEWVWPDSTFYILCGRVPVSLFFMITGFLFSQKLMMSRSRVNWRRLYLSRLGRLAPLYLFVTTMVFIVVGYVTGWTLHVAPSELLRGAARWLALGILGHHDLNGLQQSWMINPATWTLRYEWTFYALLPLLAFFLTTPRFVLVTIVLLALVYGAGLLEPVWVNFLFGIAAAKLKIRYKTLAGLDGKRAAIVAFICAPSMRNSLGVQVPCPA